MVDFCENCKYQQFIASAYDMHIDHNDCDKVNTHFCEKMRNPEKTIVIIDAGCTDKTFYHKGFKDGYESVNVVHCKDCKYWDKATANKKGFLICPASGMEITADDFCSYGERRTDDKETG